MKFTKVISCSLLLAFFGTFAFSQNDDAGSSSDSKFNFESKVEKVEDPKDPRKREVIFNEGNLYNSNVEKHYIGAAVGVTLTNFLIYGWNRYVCKADWAQVTMDSIKDPFNRLVEYDTDWYWTNFVLHPYQGGLYYMAARNCNLSVPESMIYTFAGSVMWEYAFETNLPSVNDMLYSGLAGMIPGEILYRLGLDFQGRKNKRSFASFIVNPERLLSDPIYRQFPQGPVNQIDEMSVKVFMGLSNAKTVADAPYSDLSELFPFNGGVEFDVLYGETYGNDSIHPYNQFYFEFGASLGPGSGEGATDAEKNLMYDVHLFSDGSLISWAPNWGKENCSTTIGFVAEYDFVWNSFMELTSVAPGFAIKQKWKTNYGSFEYQTHLAAELMGTTDCYYIRRDQIRVPSGTTYRDYMYTTGGEFVQKFRFLLKNGFDINWVTRAYGFYAYAKQKQEFIDDCGWSLIALSDLSVEFKFNKLFSLGVSDEFYFKKTFFDNTDKVKDYFQIHNNINLFCRFSLK